VFPFDQNNPQMYEQYAQAYQSGDHSGLDHNQLLDHVTQFMQYAPPGMQSGVLQQVFAQQAPAEYPMNGNDPQQMAQSFQQMGQQRPDLLGQLLGPGGLMSSPMAKMALTSIAGLAAGQMLQRR